MKPPGRLEERDADREAAASLFTSLPRGDLLLGYQQRTISRLRAGARLLVIEKSRRIGLTWGLAAYAVLRAAAQSSAGGDHVFYMGYEQEMAREFIDACGMWARAFAIGASEVGEEIFEDQRPDGSTAAIKAFRIIFASGFKIAALPSMPRAFRGKQGIVIVDEAAFHAALEEKIKAALALLMLGGQVIIVSTHDGVMNPFNVLIDEIRAQRRRGEVMTITFADALADGFYERRARMAAVRGQPILPKDDYIADVYGFYGDNAGEELDVIPKLGSGSLIKLENIMACEHEDAGDRPELYTGGLYRLGRDVARRRDGQIQLGFETVGDVEWLRDEYNEVGQTFAHQDAWFAARMRDRRVVQAGVDQTGMGEKVVEDLQALFGTDRVVGFLLTGPTRLALGLSLARRFEDGKMRIPRGRPDVRADLLAIKRASTTGGGVRLVNDDTVHADWFWAAAFASYLADMPVALYRYTAVPRSGAKAVDDDDRVGLRRERADDGARFRRRGAW